MFKFNRSEELVATVEKQKEQITRYEGRLRDIVQAYKSLQKEKDALEVSMKALASAAPASSDKSKKTAFEKSKISKDGEDDSETDENTDSDSKSASAEDEVDCSNIDDGSSQIQHLQSQIYTLTASLSTVTEEKAKIVATYQAEKKKKKQDTEEQVKLMREENENLVKKSQLLEEELDKTRDKVRGQQADREQEQATHSIMLREIQRMLNDERTKNENLEAVIRELQSAAKSAGQDAQQTEDYKWRVGQLEDELHEVRKRLHLAETEANTPSPLLLQLQEEMEKMKREHKLQLDMERHHVEEVEKRERQIAKNEEERVADLENRLVQISNKLGLYDGSRQKDQLSIQKLKDRISQLDVENTLLTKQLEAFKVKKEDLSLSSLKAKLEEALDIDGLKEQLIRYQQLLKEAASKSNEPVDLSDVVMSFRSDMEDYQQLYLESQQELLQLKEEFERYKARAQNVLKNMKGNQSSSAGGCNREQEELKRQLQEVRERHFHLRATCDDLQEKCSQLTLDHKREMEKQTAVHRAELESQEEKHNRRVSEVEREVRSQRERTVAMLADKDKEIRHLKAYTSAFSSEYGHVPEYVERRSSGTDDVQDPTEESVSEIMNKGSVSDRSMIHYAEQLARKDVTINSIRKHRKQLELQVRQLQDANIMKDERNAQEVARLKETMMEYERKTLRESANMEYLKNIFFQYLTSPDQQARQRILLAITTILQFSPDESRRAGVKTR